MRQSFSHGRTKQVVVEKRGKRRVGGDAPAAETHAPEPLVAKAGARCKAPRRSAARGNAVGRAACAVGVVLRTLTEDERTARASALADAKVREVEERRMAEEEAKRRASREGIEQAEREAAEARRKAEEDERRRHEEEAKQKAEPRPRSDLARTRPSPRRLRPRSTPATTTARPAAAVRRRAARARPALPPRPTRTKVRARSAAAPAAPRAPRCRPRPTHKPGPQKQRGRLTLVTALTADDVRERSVASFRRRTQRLKGHASRRAEGKAHPRGDDSGSDHHPGTRQPHVGARGGRHPPADEAGRRW